MWVRGTKNGVGVWYVCWRNEEGDIYQAEIYKTTRGLVGWLGRQHFLGFHIQRIGRIVFTEHGVREEQHWDTREAFLHWARGIS